MSETTPVTIAPSAADAGPIDLDLLNETLDYIRPRGAGRWR